MMGAEPYGQLLAGRLGRERVDGDPGAGEHRNRCERENGRAVAATPRPSSVRILACAPFAVAEGAAVPFEQDLAVGRQQRLA